MAKTKTIGDKENSSGSSNEYNGKTKRNKTSKTTKHFSKRYDKGAGGNSNRSSHNSSVVKDEHGRRRFRSNSRYNDGCCSNNGSNNDSGSINGSYNKNSSMDIGDDDVNFTSKAFLCYGREIRNLKRLINHKIKNNMDESGLLKLKERLSAVEIQGRRRKKEKKQIELGLIKERQYTKIKFFELQKVRRKIKQLRTQMVAASEKNTNNTNCDHNSSSCSDDKQKLENELYKYLKFQNYIKHYPSCTPYVALFAAGADSPEVREKRSSILSQIYAQMKEDRTASNAKTLSTSVADDDFFDIQ